MVRFDEQGLVIVPRRKCLSCGGTGETALDEGCMDCLGSGFTVKSDEEDEDAAFEDFDDEA